MHKTNPLSYTAISARAHVKGLEHKSGALEHTSGAGAQPHQQIKLERPSIRALEQLRSSSLQPML
jgi:hypothetical protein